MNSLRGYVKSTCGESRKTIIVEHTVEDDISVHRHRLTQDYVVEYDDKPDSASSRLSELIGKVEGFSSFELDRLPHNLVVALFTTQPERRIGEFHKMNDIFDNRTPDVRVDEGYLEIGTDVRGSESAYHEKMYGSGSYLAGMNIRNLKFFVLGVGSSSVTSNFHLNNSSAKAIVSAYQLGKKIQMAFTTIGFKPSHGSSNLKDVLDGSFQGVDEVLRKIPDSSLTITEEMWDGWSKSTEFENCYRTLITESIEDVKSKIGTSTYDMDKKLVSDYLASIRKLDLHQPGKIKRFPIPFAIVTKGETFDNYKDIDLSNPLGELWSQLLLSDKESDSQPLSFEDCEAMTFDVIEEESLRKKKFLEPWFKEVNRVRVDLSHSTKMDLSESGYMAKVLKKSNPSIEEKSNKRGFDILSSDLYVDDYELFLNSASDMFEYSSYNRQLELLRPIFEESGFNMSSEYGKFCEEFLNSRLGNALSFLSSLASELNVNIRKPTKRNAFYLTRIPGFKAMLAMHNTGSNKHSFYTVLVEKADLKIRDWMSCFRKWVDVGSYYALEMCSTRRHDLSQLISSQSKCMTIMASTLDVFSSSLELKHSNRGVKEALFFILVNLENSNQTSELCQQPRFCYMKTNSTTTYPWPLLDNIGKFPLIYRSRFAAFSAQRMIETFLEMSKQKQKIEEEEQEEEDHELAKDDVKLISYVSGDFLLNYEEVLSLSYAGVFHNKDKSETIASYLQIFVKMADMELKYKEGRKESKFGFQGDVSVSKFEDHDFSETHLINCGLVGLDYLSKKGLTENDMMLKIATNLDDVFYEELATFKASLSMEHLQDNLECKDGQYSFKDIKYDAQSKKPSYGRTCRALEGVLQIINKVSRGETRPYREMSNLLSACLELGGVVTVLFKKNQIGGTREIFILTMLSRIIIRFTECISRSFCDEFGNEYLTKGKDKVDSTANHYTKVKSKFTKDCRVMTMSDSLDCKTWCQRFTFPAFGVVLSVLTRSWPSLGKACRAVFNMSTVKRHELPHDLMTLFLKKPNIQSFSESMRELKNGFLGETNALSEGGQSIFVKNLTNMMQGIHHYTSSVIHSLHMMTMSKIMTKFVRESSGVHDVIHTTKVSSDDGSSILSCIMSASATDEDLKVAKAKQMVCCKMLARSYALMCAKVSIEKSTLMVEGNIEEFNSQWTYKNTILSVPTKFAAACNTFEVSRNCVERQRTDHNLLCSYIENGGTMNVCKVIEFGLAMNYYDCLGMNSVSSSFWKKLSSSLLELSHPAAWLYIFSPEFIGPTLGFDYTLGSFSRGSSNFRRTEHLLRTRVGGEYDEKSGFMVQSSLMIGDHKRYKDFLERVKQNNGMDPHQVVSMRPAMLYTGSTTREESSAVIILKAKASGAGRSFAMSDSSAMHATSCYINTSPCLSISYKVLDEITNEMTWRREKNSLPAYLARLSSMRTQEEQNLDMSLAHEAIYEIVKGYQPNFVHCGRKRKRVVKIRFPKVRTSSQIPLISCATMLWFGKYNGYSLDENRRALSEYQTTYSWLKSGYHETVEKFSLLGVSGDVHMNIKNILSDEQDKNRTITFLHAGNKSSSLITTYLSCIEYCQRRNCRLIRPDEIKQETIYGALHDIESALFNKIRIPANLLSVPNPTLNDYMEILHSRDDILLADREKMPEVRMLSSRHRKLLSIIELTAKSDLKSDDIKDILFRGMNGFIITYLEPQTKVTDADGTSRWEGKGKIQVDFQGATAILEVENRTLKEVRFSSPFKIVNYLKVLAIACKKLSINQGSVSTHGITRLTFGKSGKIHSTHKTGVPVMAIAFQRSSQTKHTFITKLKHISMKCLKCEVRVRLPNGETRESSSVSFHPAEVLNGPSPKLEYKRAVKILSSDRPLPDELERFIKMSLSDRLDRLGLSGSRKLKKLLDYTADRQSELPDDFDLMLSEMMGLDFCMEDEDLPSTPPEDFSDAESEVSNMSWANEMGSMEADLFEKLNVVEEKVSVGLDTSDFDYGGIILWDTFIENFSKDIGYSFSLLCEGKYKKQLTTNQSQSVKVLNKVLEKLISMNVVSNAKIFVDETIYEEDEDEDLSGIYNEQPNDYDL